jgi:hypothetical protein
VLGALHLRARGDWKAYLLAALTAALAVGSLQSGLAVLPAVLCAHLLRREGGTRHPHLCFAGLLALVAFAVPLYYPFVFARSTGQDAAALGMTEQGFALSGHVVRVREFDGRGLPVVLNTLRTYEPLLCALALLGLAAGAAALWHSRGTRPAAPLRGLRARLAGREDLAVVLCYVVPYSIAIGLYAYTYQRFVLPLVPFLCVLAAWGLAHAARTAAGADRGRALFAALAALAVTAQLAGAAKLTATRGREDTAQQAARWIQREIPADERAVLTPSLDLPLLRTRAALARLPLGLGQTWPWVAYQAALRTPVEDATPHDLLPLPALDDSVRRELLADPAGWFQRQGARWAVLDVSRGPLRPGFAELAAGARAAGHLVARFSPQDGADAWSLAYQDDDYAERPVWWWQVLCARRVGPCIEVYHLP